MSEPLAGGIYDRGGTVQKSMLSVLTLLFGWLGSHKFYAGYDNAGAIYFVITVLGLVLTLYELIWITTHVFGSERHINAAFFILFAPLVVSVIEFFLLQKQSEFEIQNKYPGTRDPLTLVFVAQAVFLLLLLLPLVFRAFSG
jgi:TM2 domain-containing membrane protein YozV